MKFYEVRDEDGCLTKTRNLRTAKRSALAYLTMRASRKMHIHVYPLNSQVPAASIHLDPSTRAWSAPKPLSSRPALLHSETSHNMRLDAAAS